MPRYISIHGEFHPEQERVALKNTSGKTKVVDGKEVKPGEDYIYQGPDRAALFELYRAGVEKFGQDFHHDSEFLHRIKQLGYKNINEYLKEVGYDAEKAKKEAEKRAAKVTMHELPEKVKAVENIGGGIDTSGGGQDMKGGFGEPK
jgi:hypothetical protein